MAKTAADLITILRNTTGREDASDPLFTDTIMLQYINDFIQLQSTQDIRIFKNKTFFFFLFDGQRYITKSSFIGTVLTDQARQGIFRYFPGVQNGNILTNTPTVDRNGNPVRPAAATVPGRRKREHLLRAGAPGASAWLSRGRPLRV